MFVITGGSLEVEGRQTSQYKDTQSAHRSTSVMNSRLVEKKDTQINLRTNTDNKFPASIHYLCNFIFTLHFTWCDRKCTLKYITILRILSFYNKITTFVEMHV